MCISFAPDWQDRTGQITLDEIRVTHLLWQAADPVGQAARAARGDALCHVRSVVVPAHRMVHRSLQGTVMTVEVSGEKIEPGIFALYLALVPDNPMIVEIAAV